MGRNISESDLIDFLQNIVNVEGEISLNDFIDRVAQAFHLTEYDESDSSTRPGEPMYEQRIRNIISHHNIPYGIKYENEIFSKDN